MATDPAALYKARKEAFVSNLSGSSLTEINLVTLVATAAVLLWTALQKRQALFTPYTPVAGFADFLLNVSAILFAITLYSSVPLALCISLVSPAILLLVLTSSPSSQAATGAKTKTTVKQDKTATKSSSTNASNDLSPTKATQHPSSTTTTQLPVRPFVTHYRGSMMVVTCLAILAVDFPVFPRRFAKVETWGTSLMDLGVGSFVFSAGVVSARAVVKAQSSTASGPSSEGQKTATTSFLTRFTQAIRHSIPLLVLGFIRLWSVKGLDYAEHVTEYGVHWNFFFTLALLPPFVEISDSITRNVFKYYDNLAIVVALIYETVLNNTSLLRYILISPRGPDLLSKNREGVFSFIGYLAIFLAGRGTGVSVVQYNHPSPSSAKATGKTKTKPSNSTHTSAHPDKATSQERKTVLRTLAIRSTLYITLFIVSTHISTFNLNVSRRLANLPYVLWVSSFNTAQLLLFGLIETLGPSFSYTYTSSDNDKATQRIRIRHATSRILRVFNSNGLAIFLVANLLTGLVNLTVNTLDMHNLAAMGVLVAYAAAVTGFAVALDASGVKIKI